VSAACLSLQQWSRLAVILLLGCTLWLVYVIYHPGTYGPNLLDDEANLRVLKHLDERPEYFAEVVAGNRSGPLGRPVAMLSFAAEKRWLGDGIATLKHTNIIVHLVTGAALFALLWQLLAVLAVPAGPWLALLGAAAWLLLPLQVSTVLYPVQRMAQLATLLVVLSLLAYTLWRRAVLAGAPGWRHGWLLLALLAAGAAPFAKENGALVLPLLVWLEWSWFACRGRAGIAQPRLARALMACMVLGCVAAIAVLVLDPLGLMGGYAIRDFSASERLLTQARVLWDYLGQAVWPDISRMGVYHDDVAVSRSLWEPMTTGVAVFAWALLLVLLIPLAATARGRPVVGAIGLFLIAHLLESTVFPVELYFEHRNYLPLVGLVLLACLLWAALIRRWPAAQAPLLVVAALLLLPYAVRTAAMVELWSTRPTLLLQAATAHPQSRRAQSDLAVWLAEQQLLDAALERDRRTAVLGKDTPNEASLRALVYFCLARRVPERERLQAFDVGIADKNDGAFNETFSVLANLLQNDRCPQFPAQEFADRLMEIWPEPAQAATLSPRLAYSAALIEHRLDRPAHALSYIRFWLARNPDNVTGLLMQLHFATAAAEPALAEVARVRLTALAKAGKLSLQQRDTFELYAVPQ